MNVFELFAKVSVNRSQAVTDIRAIEDAGSKASGSMGPKFQKLGDDIGKWVKRGALVAGAAMAALGATSLKNFATMDTKMREVFTLMPGLSEQAKDQMTADIKDVAREIGVLPNEAIPALYQAISAGVPQDNVFEFMETAGKAAKGGVTDLETAVDALSSVVNAYGSDAMSATEASDAMFTAVRLGKTTFDELGKYLFQVTPVAAAVGVSFDQIAAAMAEITSKGVPTRVAATQLRQMLVELSKAGGETADIFEELSGKSFRDFMDEGNDLADVLALMQEYADANNISLMDMFSSVEGGMAALNLGGSNIDSFVAKLAEMDEKALATEKAFEEMTAGIQFRLDQLASWWQTVQINIGGEMQAGLEDLLDWVETNQDKIEAGLIKIFSGLISGLEWIMRNGAAVKVALLVIAAGLFAIYAIVNPLQAALGVVVLTLGAAAFAAVKAKDSFDELSGVMQVLNGDMEDGGNNTQDIVDSFELGEDAAREFTEELQRLDNMFGTMVDYQGDLWKLTTAQAEAMNALRKEYIAMGISAGLTGTQLSGYTDALYAAYASALDMGGDVAANFGSNMREVLKVYGMVAPGLGEITDTIVEHELTAYEGLQAAMEIYYAWKAEKQAADAAAAQEAFDSAVSAIESVDSPLRSAISKIQIAYRSLTGSTEETAEDIAKAWSDITTGIANAANTFLDSISEMYSTNRALKKEHEAEMLAIEEESAADLVDAATSRDDALSSARDQADSAAESEAERHAAKLESIQRTYDDKMRSMDKDNTDAAIEAAFVRDRALQDEAIENAANQTKIADELTADLGAAQDAYTTDTVALTDARTDAIDAEVAAYEEAKITIWEILKEMGRNILTAIREELTLQATKYLVMGAAALLNPLTALTAPGYFLQSAALYAGAASLAIAGFAKGGIATQATMGMVGEAGVSEGVIPLTLRNLSAIGKGIASASGFSREPLSAAGIPGLGGGTNINLGSDVYPSAGGGAVSRGPDPSSGAMSVNIHFDGDVSIREEEDITKLSEAIQGGFAQTRRSLGWAGAT